VRKEIAVSNISKSIACKWRGTGTLFCLLKIAAYLTNPLAWGFFFFTVNGEQQFLREKSRQVLNELIKMA